jgi:hypothetical protein
MTYSAWLDTTQPLNKESLYEAIQSIKPAHNKIHHLAAQHGQYFTLEYGERDLETIEIMHQDQEALNQLLLVAETILQACTSLRELITQAAIIMSDQ